MSKSHRRGSQRLIGVIALAALLYFLLIIWQGGLSSPTAQINLLIDLALFGLGIIFWLVVFAHFVLPLRSRGEMLDVAMEILRALLGLHPSALFIKNGEPVSDNSANRTRLLLLDCASAAVLHNESTYTRAIGPGLSIGRRGERIAGIVDLRIQRRTLGPHSQEDPFAAQARDETPAAHEARQQRRIQTSALTRDGIEVLARIDVELRVDGRQGQGGSPFGFQVDASWRAIAHKIVATQVPSDARGRQLSWDWLPVHLAADLWREHLRKFMLADLFIENPENFTTLEFIEGRINHRLQESIVPELDERGSATGRQTSSPEYRLLRSRGLRVLAVHLRQIFLEREPTPQLVSKTTQSPSQQGKQSSAETEDLPKRREAQIEFARRSTTALYQRLLKTDGREVPPPDEKETLELLISGAVKAVGSKQRLSELAERLKGKRDGAS